MFRQYICLRESGVSKTQTSKTQTSDRKNSDPLGVSKTQTLKTQPSACRENSDPKISDPFGVSKTQTLKTQTLRKLDNSNPKIKKIKQHVPRITANRLVSRKLRPQTLKYQSYLESPEKIKRLAVQNTSTPSLADVNGRAATAGDAVNETRGQTSKGVFDG